MATKSTKREESGFIEIKEPKNRNISNVGSMAELDDVLRMSFANIKRDMLSLKESQHQQMIKLAEIRQKFNDAKTEFVTLDKFNVLKIKIGEINENLKKIWDLDSKITGLEDNKLNEDEFAAQIDKWEDNIENVKTDIEEIKSKSATNKQLQGLVEDVNDEFDKIKASISQLSSVKDTIKKKEIDKVKARLKDIDLELSENVKRSQVENLIEDVNIEFDNVKELTQDIKEATLEKMQRAIDGFDSKLAGFKDTLKKFKEAIKEHPTRKQLKKLGESLNNDLDSLAEDIDDNHDLIERLRKNSATKNEIKIINEELKQIKKESVFKDQAETLIDDVNNEFEDIRAKIKGSVQDHDELKKSLKKQFDAKIDRREFEDESAELWDRIEALEDEVDELTSGMIRNKEVKRMRDLFEKELKLIKKSMDKNNNLYDKDLNRLFSEQEKLAKKTFKISVKPAKADKKAKVKKESFWNRSKNKKDTSASRKEQKVKKKSEYKAPSERLPLFGNLFIGLAFALLVISIIVFFFGMVKMTDYLAIIAVVSFVVGLVLRIRYILKK